MRLERAVRFGFVGSIGVTAISLVTFWMLRRARTNASYGAGETALLVLVGAVGTAIVLMFLFALIDVFVDEKLDARGGAGPEE